MSNLEKLVIEIPEIHNDNRGVLYETYRQDKARFLMKQVYLSISHPNIIRGNHYHLHKVESFCVIAGEADLSLIDIETKQQKKVNMNGQIPRIIIIPPKVAHAIQAKGNQEMILLLMVSEEYNAEESDTYPFEVLEITKNE